MSGDQMEVHEAEQRVDVSADRWASLMDARMALMKADLLGQKTADV